MPERCYLRIPAIMTYRAGAWLSRRRPERRCHRHGCGWAEGGHAHASGGPGYPGRAADRMSRCATQIDLDAELCDRRRPWANSAPAGSRLDRLDHLGDGSLPLFEQPHAGAFDLLAEVHGASRPVLRNKSI